MDDQAEDKGSDAETPKRKPPPPRVRIRTTDKGAKVVEAPEPAPTPKGAPKAPTKGPPPLEEGTVALAAAQVAKEAPRKDPEQMDAAPKKPPPPHVARGPRTPKAEAPAAAPAPVPPPPPEPVKVSARPARSRATRKKAEPAPQPDEGAPTPAAQEGSTSEPATARPHIGTDEGRLSALSAAMWLLLLVLAVEVYAGFASNSLALFSDASHVFTDFFAYAIAAAAVELSRRRSNSRETFGLHRAEVIAAFLSGLILVAVVLRIYAEAATHLARPEPVDLTYMLTVPWLAVFANLYLARRLSGAQDVNIEGARLHAVSDLLSSLGVIAAGVLIAATGNQIFDPLVSFFIGFLILAAAFRLLRESADILLERSPHKIDVTRLIDRIKSLDGVVDVHQVHAWSLCSTVHAISAHVVATPGANPQAVLEGSRNALKEHFGVAYTTLQVETEPCGAEQHPTAVHSPSDHAHSHA